jgi:hypothetical protein
MDDVAAPVTENLKLDVVRVFDELSRCNRRIAEGLLRLGAGSVIALHERNVVVRHAHPATAAPGDGFDHHRVTDASWRQPRHPARFRRSLPSREGRDAGLLGKVAADGLVFQAFIARELGPMNRMLQLSQTSAKCAFSERNPYPG